MAIPSYEHFIEPILRYLVERPDGAPARDVHEAAADALGVTDTDRNELLPSGVQAVYKNRAGWAHDRLKRAGLSSSLRRGYWRLTEKGTAYAATHPGPLTRTEVEAIAGGFNDVRLRPKRDAEIGGPGLPQPPYAARAAAAASPDDRLEEAIAELRRATAEDLLESIGNASPKFFEVLVLDLLHAMGYGATRADLQHVGRSGDGGIDGIISLDRLGLERVFVQAKRWQSSVGREAVQAFYGALAGQRAHKGVFITTSAYTAQALEFAKSVEKIVLIDGPRLADLLMEYGVGVTHRLIKLPKVDSDYFDE